VQRAALLTGDHPTLPAAELRALLDVHAPGASLQADGLVASAAGEGGLDAAFARMALLHEWGEPWADAEDSEPGLAALEAAVSARADGRGAMAVRTERRGVEKSTRSIELARLLGAALKAGGHRIDLRRPDRVLYGWLLDGRIHVGERLGTGHHAFEARVTDERAHFSPVSLHPRRAASLLHLARVPPGGTLYDPFCGTGGFVLEAALEGYKVLASDLDAFMVQGTLQTLADVPPEPLDAEAFVADIGDAAGLVGPVDGIVTDLPYGRASGTDKEPVRDLYVRAFEAFARLLRPGGHAVVGHADASLVPDRPAAGLRVVERHQEYSHKSLTRHFAVVKRVEGVDAL
jgi:tRNA (guanine10-N2)-dimethyltransferase